MERMGRSSFVGLSLSRGVRRGCAEPVAAQRRNWWILATAMGVSLLVGGCDNSPASSGGSGTAGSSSGSPAAPAYPDITMQSQAGRVAVIMFHDVLKARAKKTVWFDCTADEFQKDIDEIKQNGFTVL